MSETKTKKKVSKKKTTKKAASSEPVKKETKHSIAKLSFQYQGKKIEKGQKFDLGIEALKELREQGLVE